MKLVIDIPENEYRHIKEIYEKNDIVESTYSYIYHGTPLSERLKWIFVSERLPNNHEYIKNNGLFNVSDGNRSYFGWFDIYDTKKFVKPTIAGFRVDNAVIAWMPLPEPCKDRSRRG